MAVMGRIRLVAIAGLLLACGYTPVAAAAAPSEQQVKAVFLFNFSNFIDWPADAFTAPGQPFTVCLLGGEALASHLDEALRGEAVDGRPMQLRRIGAASEADGCQMLFIDRAHDEGMEGILGVLRRRGLLTVSDLDGAARRGVMIQLFNENNRIRLVINVEEARQAGLVISSNLLRPAQIVRTEPRGAP
jgi:hypothetical protein